MSLQKSIILAMGGVGLFFSLLPNPTLFSFWRPQLFVFVSFFLFAIWSWHRSWIEFFYSHRRWIVLSGLWLFIVTLSTVTSLSPVSSFWMGIVQSDGLIVSIGMVLMFWVLLDLFSSVAFRDQFLRLAVSLGVIWSLVGILQALGWNITGTRSPDSGVASVFEHPSYFASALVWTIFLTAYAGARWRKEKKNVEKRRVDFVVAAMLGIQFIALLLTLTRGAWVAMTFGLVCVWINVGMRRSFYRQWLLLSLVAILAGGGIWTVAPNISERVRSVVEWETGTGRLRVLWWRHAWDAISERPWFGYGYHTSVVPMMQRNEPEEGWWAEVDTDTNLSHNTILDEALATGWLGVASLGLLVIVASIVALRKESSIPSRWLVIGVGAHLVNGMFIFPTIMDRLLLWAVLALLIARSSSATKPEPFRAHAPNHPSGAVPLVKRAVVSLFVLAIFFFIVEQAMLAHKFRRFEKEIRSTNPAAEFALERFVEGMGSWSWRANQFHFELGVLNTLLQFHDVHRPDQRMSKEGMVKFEMKVAKAATQRFPDHPQLRLAMLRLAFLNPDNSADQRLLMVREIKEDYPTWPKVDEVLGRSFDDAGQHELALEFYSEALKKYGEPSGSLQAQMLPSVHLALLQKQKTLLRAMGRIAVESGNTPQADQLLAELRRREELITALERTDQAIPWHK